MKSTKKIGLDEFKRHTGALIEHVDDVFKITNEEIRGIHQKLEPHTQMLGQIMMDVEQIKFDLKQKVSYDDLAKLEKRVARMEIKLQSA